VQWKNPLTGRSHVEHASTAGPNLFQEQRERICLDLALKHLRGTNKRVGTQARLRAHDRAPFSRLYGEGVNSRHVPGHG